MLVLTVFGFSGGISGQPSAQVRPDWKSYYERWGVHGCFLLYDLRADRMHVYNPARCDSAFLPASTFKIFNSLVALETAVVQDENDTIRWDGVERPIAGWNADQNMRSAIRYSTVWFYQELARRIGERRMQEYISRSHYGNEDISGGIDLFWLEGGLRITPREQTAFLRRLYDNDLPFSNRTMEKVKEILILERTDEYIFRGKTGWAARPEKEVGWFVGYLERGRDAYFFANCIDITREEDTRARIGITREILQDLGLMERPD
jgi:beta-lactamase class D